MQGRLDYPLTALGREQAARAGEFLRARGGPFAAAYASPLKRAFSKPRASWRPRAYAPRAVPEDLPEIGAGAIEGLNEAEIRASVSAIRSSCSAQLDRDGRFSRPTVVKVSADRSSARAAHVSLRLVARHRHAEERVLLVGHGGFHYQLAKTLLCEPVTCACAS